MNEAKREIYVVEDDAPVRDSLSFLLTSAGYKVVCFADGEALKTAARAHCPACILLDVNLPGRSGLQILEDLSKGAYPAPIVMMTGAATIEIAVNSLKMGASDFIAKPFVENDLIACLEQAMASGGARASDAGVHPESMARQAFAGRKPLTKREQEVLHQILQGRSNKDVSQRLGLSPRTTEVHRASIMKKLGARSTVDLLRIAFENSSAGADPQTQSSAD